MPELDPAALAVEILSARARLVRLRPFSQMIPGFDRKAANRVAEDIDRIRQAGGDRPVGRKIGFTNRNIWDEYGVHAPIWGNVYDTTLHQPDPGGQVTIKNLSQPRIEPEIVIGLDHDLGAGATLAEAEQAVAWIAHGFEVVQTVFDDWKFAVADCVAEGGLHGLLIVGPRRPVARREREGLAARLAALRVELWRDGEAVDHGVGANVLDGPVHALTFAAREIALEGGRPLQAGELVTTGTMTRAFPIAPGERWSTIISGYELPGMDVVFA